MRQQLSVCPAAQQRTDVDISLIGGLNLFNAVQGLVPGNIRRGHAVLCTWFIYYGVALWVDKRTILDSGSLRHAPGLRLSTTPGPEIDYRIKDEHTQPYSQSQGIKTAYNHFCLLSRTKPINPADSTSVHVNIRLAVLEQGHSCKESKDGI